VQPNVDQTDGEVFIDFSDEDGIAPDADAP
jgi:hypothetical protein